MPTLRPDESDAIDEELMRRSIKERLFGETARPIQIGRFTVLRKLGEGGMGAVYAAYDEQLDRKIAVKVLRPSQNVDPHEGTSRLMREAQAMARLSHANVVQIYEVGRDAGQVFLAMQFIEGTNLEAWIAEGGHRWRDVLSKYLQAGRGLAAAHRAGIIHRDFKPANVLIDGHGLVRVGDFGTARGAEPAPGESGNFDGPGGSSLHQKLTAPGAAVGTPAYMSPEQYMGMGIDARSDQFSFCAALWEGVYGAHPFGGNERTVLLARALEGKFQEPPARKRVPPRIRRILERGLDAHPDRRFPDMDTLLAALERASRPRVPWQAAVGVGTVVVALGLAFYPWSGDCDGAQEEIGAVWNGARRAELGTRLESATPDAWPQAARALDGWVRRWSAAREGACKNTRVLHAWSESALNRRTACLDRQRNRLAAQLDAIADLDASQPDRLLRAATDLPEPEQCEQPQLIAAALPPESDAPLVATVAGIRDRLDRAAVLEVMGSLPASLEQAQRALKDAQAAGFEPVVAEAFARQASALAALGQAQEAKDAFERAVDHAEASRHDLLAPLIWIRRLEIAAAGQASLDEAHEWSRRADATTRRIGDPPLLRARAQYQRGRIAQMRGEFGEARRYLEDAVRLRETVLGAEDPLAQAARTELAKLDAGRDG